MLDPEDPSPNESAPKPRGRRAREATERTVQVSLRLPATWVGQLRRRALIAASKEQTMVTPQEIVRRMIAEALENGDAKP